MTYNKVDERAQSDVELGMAHEIDASHRLNDGVVCWHIVHDPLVFLPDNLRRPHRIQILIHQIPEACISSSFIISALIVAPLDHVSLYLILTIVGSRRRGVGVSSLVRDTCLLPLSLVSEEIYVAYTKAHWIP